MSLVSGTIPNLLGGISQQPAILRHPNQLEDQRNMVSSLVEGLSKRSPMEHYAYLGDDVIDHSNVFFHWIDRDPTERYLLILKSGAAPVVYDLINKEFKTVNTPDGIGYLTAPNPPRDFRAVTVADHTFIVNRTVQVQASDELSDEGVDGIAVNVVIPANGTTYHIEVTGTGLTTIDVSHQTADTGIISIDDIAAALASQINQLAGWHAVQSNGAIFLTNDVGKLPVDTSARAWGDNSEQAMKLTFHRVQNFTDLPTYNNSDMIVEVAGDPTTEFDNYYVRSHRIDGTRIVVGGERVMPYRVGTGTHQARSNPNQDLVVPYPAETLPDDLLLLSVMATDNGEAPEITPPDGWTLLVSKLHSNGRVLLQVYYKFATGDEVGNNVTIEWDSSRTAGSTDAALAYISAYRDVDMEDPFIDVGTHENANETSTPSITLTMPTVETDTENSLAVVVYASPIVPSSWQNPIDPSGETGGDWDWEYSRGVDIDGTPWNVWIAYLTAKMQVPGEISGGSVTLPHGGNSPALTGQVTSSVKFALRGRLTFENLGHLEWRETVAPSVKYKFDPATMPHLLVREADGTFTFKCAEWTPRDAGDDRTNPWPDFLDRKIADVFFFKNRLGFLSGESACLSKIGEYFQFFRSTVTTLLDDDPINVSVSTNEVANLQYSALSGGRMFAFSSKLQFELRGDPLTPKTAALVNISRYLMKDAPPLVGGNSIFFPFDRGAEFSGIWELIPSENSDDDLFEDITSHVPKLIEGDIAAMAYSTVESTLYLLPRNPGRRKIFVYKSHWEDRIEGRERVVSSWSYWDFPLDLLSIHVLDEYLYAVVFEANSDRLAIVRMDLRDGVVEAPGWDWKFLLDFRMKSDHPDLSSSFSDGATTFTLPYRNWSQSSTPLQVFDLDTLAEITPVSVNPSTGEVVLEGDQTSANLLFGMQYTAIVKFTRPVPRQRIGERQVPLADGDLYLLFWSLNFVNSGRVRSRVFLRDGRVRGYTKVGSATNKLGSLKSGDFKFPVRAKANGGATIDFINDKPYPSHLVNAGWEGNFILRSRLV